ncbi:hypothetical protein EW093_13740 [Thiospirochaeta perfilievii]|uniref:DUF5723 domain-containing protein n=1 Tax=Thiospirochaeta perfilievii TaxID=252967 RepID=A0A5C1QF97_9SPIO|nr:hypothetical protein [Thiospirochaeta perfilievii]QEN05729.1 hypothetical protein EW093_13740 [Thiospirochaeta perfilievii]
MKKLILLIISILIIFNIHGEDSFFEKKVSFNSPKILGMGNTFVANANGLESFEYNPAGLNGDGSFTIFNGNFNLISNFIQLSDDLVASYNEANSTDKTSIELGDLSYYLDPINRREIIGALISQATTPYLNNKYANGLGYSSSISLGYAGNGFGFGLLFSLDSEVYGESLTVTQLDSILTTSLLLGYGISLDLGIIGLEIGAAARPMYKIRTTTSLNPVVEYLLAENSGNTTFIEELDYKTGVGIGFDLGVKARFMGLTAGIALLDIFGTTINYSSSSYDDIINGDFLGSKSVDDIYITPTTLNLGLSFNPGLGSVSRVFNPTLSIDYSVPFITDGSLEDYAMSSQFWRNLSLGAEVELFSLLSLRSGLNQGYFTAGFGLELFILDVNFAIYSKELGARVGDRQQMGAAFEIGLRL